jgi:hypothetical protein
MYHHKNGVRVNTLLELTAEALRVLALVLAHH